MVGLNFQTWLTQQVGYEQSSDALMTSYDYDVTIQQQHRYQNFQKLPFWVVANSY